MRNIREILRQKWSLNRSHREVAASLNISIGGVSKIVGKADEAALTWDAVLTWVALPHAHEEDPPYMPAPWKRVASLPRPWRARGWQERNAPSVA